MAYEWLTVLLVVLKSAVSGWPYAIALCHSSSTTQNHQTHSMYGIGHTMPTNQFAHMHDLAAVGDYIHAACIAAAAAAEAAGKLQTGQRDLVCK
jgi:hypothetical protein